MAAAQLFEFLLVETRYDKTFSIKRKLTLETGEAVVSQVTLSTKIEAET